MSTIASTQSKNKKIIKLTTERWLHITESHDYMAGYFHNVLETINDPDYIVAGKKEEILAIKSYKKTHIGPKYLICCYIEKNKEGFVKRRKILWQRQ